MFTEKQVQRWCDRHGYSDPQLIDNRWWAIPPHGVIPVCIHAELAELPEKGGMSESPVSLEQG